MKTVMVDRKNCIGCQNCTWVCPKIFQMAEGASVPNNEFFDITTDSELMDRAIAECPVSVISWSDSEKPAVSEKIKKNRNRDFFSAFFPRMKKQILRS